MTQAQDLCRALGGDWRGHGGNAPCPVCQPERRTDQRGLSIRSEVGQLLAFVAFVMNEAALDIPNDLSLFVMIDSLLDLATMTLGFGAVSRPGPDGPLFSDLGERPCSHAIAAGLPNVTERRKKSHNLGVAA
jgi:hypothetical protein